MKIVKDLEKFNFTFQKDMTNPTILVSLIVLCLFTACSYSGDLVEVHSTSKDGKAKYAISFPNYMESESKKILGEGADLQYCSFYRNVYCIVIEESKTDTNFNLKEFSNKKIEELENSVKNPLRIDSLQMELASNKALQMQIVGKVGEGELEKRILYRLVFIEADEHVFQLNLWGWDERRENYLEDFDRIVKSFHLLN